MARVFTASNYVSVTRVWPQRCAMPLRMREGWNVLDVDLARLTHEAYGTQYTQLTRITLHANCRVLAVYAANRSDLEFPFTSLLEQYHSKRRHSIVQPSEQPAQHS